MRIRGSSFIAPPLTPRLACVKRRDSWLEARPPLSAKGAASGRCSVSLGAVLFRPAEIGHFVFELRDDLLVLDFVGTALAPLWRLVSAAIASSVDATVASLVTRSRRSSSASSRAAVAAASSMAAAVRSMRASLSSRSASSNASSSAVLGTAIEGVSGFAACARSSADSSSTRVRDAAHAEALTSEGNVPSALSGAMAAPTPTGKNTSHPSQRPSGRESA